MPFKTNQHAALVTGASQGIGREIAIQLAKAGTRVVITSNDLEKLVSVADEIKKMGAEAISILGDATLESDIEMIVNQAMQHFGEIDILINNVGAIGRIAPFEEIHRQEWQELFTLNVMSGITFTKLLLPSMKKKHWGRIIFLSSEKAIEPGCYLSHYAMTKAGILSIAKSLANEIGRDGITVNSISPGVILTPSWDKDAQKLGLTRSEYAKKFCQNVLTGQPLGTPEDVASLVCYLCSDSARWITGSNFRIDGGAIKSVQI